MSDENRLLEAMVVLGPNEGQAARWRRRIEARVERERRSLAQEWLDLLRAEPLRQGGLVLAAACALLVSTPLGSVLWALIKTGTGG